MANSVAMSSFTLQFCLGYLIVQSDEVYYYSCIKRKGKLLTEKQVLGSWWKRV